MQKLFKRPNVLSDIIYLTTKSKAFFIAVCVWFAAFLFFIGTFSHKISTFIQDKSVIHKVGYCITYLGGSTDTIRFEFKQKSKEPFDSFLKLNSNGCVEKKRSEIVACGVRKVELLYTQTYYPVK
jgi:hypothetical protein